MGQGIIIKLHLICNIYWPLFTTDDNLEASCPHVSCFEYKLVIISCGCRLRIDFDRTQTGTAPTKFGLATVTSQLLTARLPGCHPVREKFTTYKHALWALQIRNYAVSSPNTLHRNTGDQILLFQPCSYKFKLILLYASMCCLSHFRFHCSLQREHNFLFGIAFSFV